ncbi:acyltransferase [Pseudomonas sp. RTB3]|uniref:acyltransferase family protein n=1 Tax=unclassified Pseudomonas TaxID=196821 RepID=UPI002B22C1E7|nr:MULTISPECIES: acyltransferase [unclassified Pseudomonas]MEB0007625.1 acyltransferase [Pseudomonas sp. RTB2]MEB0018852.1 acyltransferase [Pseudomonas sp. RTB3]MEB0270760.1 acyltransferase [Pseudomonas sp. 5B4]
MFSCSEPYQLQRLSRFYRIRTIFLLKSLAFLPAENPSGVGLFPLLTVGWTLNYEMAFYAIFFLALYAPKKLRLPTIFLGIYILAYIVPKLNGSFSFYTNKIVFEFLMGILIALMYKKDWFQFINLPVALTLAAGSIYTVVTTAGVNHEPIRFGVPCSLLVIASLSQEKRFPKNAFIATLGDWSYSTYLSHVLVICYMYKAQNTFNLSLLTTLAIICLTILITSYLSYTFIEKPFTNFTKKTLNKDTVLKLNNTQNPAESYTPEDPR